MEVSQRYVLPEPKQLLCWDLVFETYVGFDRLTEQDVGFTRWMNGGPWDEECATKQLEMLRPCKHPNIIEMYDIVEMPENKWMVFELMDTDLHEEIKENEKSTGSRIMDRDRIKLIMKQLLSAIACLHSKGIAHQHLNPATLLFKDDVLKLGYFDKAEYAGEMCYSLDEPKQYCAPEMLCGADMKPRRCNMEADMWSAGCIFFKLLTGYYPFAFVYLSGDHLKQKEEKLKKLQWWFEESGVRQYDLMVKDNIALQLMERMLKLDPEERITAQDALNSDYFKG